jgi:hypothetical protein
MRNTLKEELTQKAPLQAVGVYEEVIKQVEKGLLAALQIIHNFVHEDSTTLKMARLRSNVEYAYFTVALLQDILHTSFIIDTDSHRSALKVIW